MFIFLIYISFSIKPDLGYRTNKKVNMLDNFSVFPTQGSGTRQSRFGFLLCDLEQVVLCACCIGHMGEW